MNILVVHQNFPGQFPHIVTALLARGDKVAAIGGPTATARPGVDLRRWKLGRGTAKDVFDHAVRAEADLIRAAAAHAAAAQLKRDGFNPDVIIGHPGWGETIQLRLVWPDVRIVLFGEYWYRGVGGDGDFDPEFPNNDPGFALRANAKNATQSLAYAVADAIICPTAFQASSFPPSLRERIIVAHEGVDLDRARPLADSDAGISVKAGLRLNRSTPYVTLVNRTLEPMRGFHIFMRALPAFLRECPEAHAVIIGEDKPAGYGAASPDGKSWKARMLTELAGQLDLDRVHFVGRMSHPAMLAALNGGAAHVYYTYPFVLSWSLAEAMACECLVLASDTGPVRDAISDGENGRLLPFFDTATLSKACIDAVRHPERYRILRKTAREDAMRLFSRDQGTRTWLAQLQASPAT